MGRYENREDRHIGGKKDGSSLAHERIGKPSGSSPLAGGARRGKRLMNDRLDIRTH